MWTPVDKADETKTLIRYGGDMLALPVYMRQYYLLSVKKRHAALMRRRGRCWDMVRGGVVVACPCCNTGRKIENLEQGRLI